MNNDYSNTLNASISTDDLQLLATGRMQSLFYTDMKVFDADIRGYIKDRRILVIGGAGSIGASTIRLLCEYKPSSLHVVDISENGLAELVRDLRSRSEGLEVEDFRTLPIDYNSELMRRYINEMPQYDLVMNFAALKHVRSEKDVYSMLQMLGTNVLGQVALLNGFSESGYRELNYFSVSTDKAANPVNVMGASKRLMEHFILSDNGVNKCCSRVTTARFANVAFSDGSLLNGFINRFQKRQPIAVPREVKRFFISIREAAEICVLATICAPNRSILIPKIDEKKDACELVHIAEKYLRNYDLNPAYYDDEEKARRAVATEMANKMYPVLLTGHDTDGEKLCEEFVGRGEEAQNTGFSKLRAISYAPERVFDCDLNYERLCEISKRDEVEKSDIVEMLVQILPEFIHKNAGKTLDDRM